MQIALDYGLDMTLADRKDNILRKLQSPSNPEGYKRYLGSPLRYAGGKSLAVGHIIKLLPNELGRVVSPFFGGGSVEISIAKELGVDVIGYDILIFLLYIKLNQLYLNRKMFCISIS